MKNLLKIFLVVASCATPVAAQMGHTNLAGFNSEIPGDASVSILDFEASLPVLDSGDSLEGFQFVFDFDGEQLAVRDEFTALSGNNYLGTTDAGMMQDGDDMVVNVEPSNAFGIHFITKDTLLDGDISLTFNGVTVSSIALDIQQTLSDGSFVYFLGVTSDIQTDTTAVITTIGGGFFLYNVDDIVRAEDPTILLGDVNLDGIVNLLDVDPFIAVLSGAPFQAEADCDENGVVNLLDVDPFITILSGGS